MRKFIDIGFNLTDEMFLGIYRDKQRHANDIYEVLTRAKECHVDKLFVTGSCLETSMVAIESTSKWSNDSNIPELYCTVGVHPCSSASVPLQAEERSKYFDDLKALTKKNKVVMYGEMGLDYDRLHYASKEVQNRVFAEQLKLAPSINLPLFLHSRNASADFVQHLRETKAIWDRYSEECNSKPNTCDQNQQRPQIPFTGVVHSFTGTADELKELLDLGLFIGLNGCSFKTQENIDVAKQVPLSNLLLESDAPWCKIKQRHPSYKYKQVLKYPVAKKPEKKVEGMMVKGRNAPCEMENVARVYAGITNNSLDDVAEVVYQNTIKLLGL